DVTVHYANESYQLPTHEFVDGTVDPHGYLLLESFHLDDGIPVWRYAIRDALIEKRIMMSPGKNTTYVHFTVLRASSGLDIEMMPLRTSRHYHSQSHGEWDMDIREIVNGFEVAAFYRAHHYRITCVDAEFKRDPAWYWNFKHRAESERGLDDNEDLFRPGY